MSRITRNLRWLGLLVLLALPLPSASADRITLQVRDTDIAEVVEMIAKHQRANVLLSSDVGGSISLSLYEAKFEDALGAVADAAGFALDKRGKNYFIVPHEEVGGYRSGNLTAVRIFELNYVDGEELKTVIENHLSLYGKANFIPERDLLIVHDTHEFLFKVARLIKTIDRKPRQVMIEAKILEVALTEDEQLGLDWANLFASDNGDGTFGVRGNAAPANDGFFFDLLTPDVEVALSALQDEGRVQTVSTPKLVALEKQEASVVIGDRRGYQVTTTINQVTTESIEFLESGVILRITAEIDSKGGVLLAVHPEVSTGTVDANGIPSQTTTEVTTKVLVPTGETVFIGGLIKKTESQRRKSVPGVNAIPLVRRLFSGHESSQLTTETVVLIRPVIAELPEGDWNTRQIRRMEEVAIEVPQLESWELSPAKP